MDPFDRLRRFLFDFSAAQENRQEVEDILTATMALSETDADFLKTLRHVLNEWEGSPERGRYRYHTFLRFMGQYRRPADRPDAWHLRVRHLIDDLPRIYGGGVSGNKNDRPT